MSKPTLLSPWFTVTRFVPADIGDGEQRQWYVTQEDGDDPWSYDRMQARLFSSIHDAHRVARGGGGYVVALCDGEDLSEYRRG
jgi:hypothetical protein